MANRCAGTSHGELGVAAVASVSGVGVDNGLMVDQGRPRLQFKYDRGHFRTWGDICSWNWSWRCCCGSCESGDEAHESGLLEKMHLKMDKDGKFISEN